MNQNAIRKLPKASVTTRHTTGRGERDRSLLLSVISVILATIAEHITEPYRFVPPLGIFFHVLAFTILGITLIYLLFELVHQLILALYSRSALLNFCLSSFLGSLLFCLVLLLIAHSSTEPVFLTAVTISLSLFSGIMLFVIILLYKIETPTQPASRQHRDKTSSMITSLATPTFEQSEVIKEEKKPIPTYTKNSTIVSTLSPLFEDDPLYALPHPTYVRFFSVVKGNDIPVASDDACAISPNETRLALCDGASASSLPRPWATLLAQNWIKEPLYTHDANALEHWLEAPRQQWEQWVRETWLSTLNQRNSLTGRKPVSPEAIHKTLQTGASATLLGLELFPRQCFWRATALGDTCLFMFRHDQSAYTWRLITSMPLADSVAFNDRPPLLRSHNNAYPSPNHYLHSIESSYHRGDILIMATDALAQWLFSQIEQEQQDWLALFSLQDQQHFTKLVNQERQRGRLVDDDTTVVIIPL